MPENAASGDLTITAPASTAAEPVVIRVQGKAMIDGLEVQREGHYQMLLSREANPAAFVLTLPSLAVAFTSSPSFRVQGPPAVEVVKGSSVSIAVALARGPTVAALPIQVSGSLSAVPAQPPNLYTLPAVTAQAGAANATLVLTPGAAVPEGKMTLILQGKARVKNVDEVVFAQAVPLTVHAPFTVVLESPTLPFSPGSPAVLKGKVQRQPSFKEAVQLRLDGLPAGVVLAKPIGPVAANASDFQIELRVDKKYQTPMASLSVTASTRLGAVPYARPPLPVTLSLAK